MKQFSFLRFVGRAAQADRARVRTKPRVAADRYDRLGGY